MSKGMWIWITIDKDESSTIPVITNSGVCVRALRNAFRDQYKHIVPRCVLLSFKGHDLDMDGTLESNGVCGGAELYAHWTCESGPGCDCPDDS